MLTPLAVAALVVLQGAGQPPRAAGDSTPPRSGSRNINVSIGAGATRPPRIELTPELEASAYRDAAARSIIARARTLRTAQEVALQSYEATTYQRFSLKARIRALGRDRLFMRSETTTRIRWQRGIGAHIDVLGSRIAVPVVSPEVGPHAEGIFSAALSVPYFPGRESLWPMGHVGDDTRITSIWRHPLREGAEAYYRFATGDSIRIRLSTGAPISLKEIRIEPRTPRWDLVAGSFWFDVASGQLVRALYRPSTSLRLDVGAGGLGIGGALVAASLQPLAVSVNAVSVEFALHEGRWWLPRTQSVEGEAHATAVRLPVELRQSFVYDRVNGIVDLPPIALPRPDVDSVAADTGRGAGAGAEIARSDQTCRAGGVRTRVRRLDSLLVLTTIPCDSAILVHSPSLPRSIFDPDDASGDETEVELLRRALGMRAQAAFSPGAPDAHFGLDLARYNRVEGLSLGAALRQEYGRGYSAELVGRVGTADLHPRSELAIARRDAFRTMSLTAYERLAVAGDWGAPLGLGASLGALIFGVDEGLYYRATGIELAGRGTAEAGFSWRIFAERHRDADVETQGSLARALGGNRFRPNIDAAPGDVLGGALRFAGTLGLDPTRPRLFSDLRIEAMAGDHEAGRGMLDATLNLPLAGGITGALTAAGGSSVGDVPPQRLWYLGGSQTIRGQPVGAASGDAFWMGRAELGFGRSLIRQATFFDLGWAGPRSLWDSPGRPISGAGAGISLLDGILRFDLARGVNPSRGWRGALFLDARF